MDFAGIRKTIKKQKTVKIVYGDGDDDDSDTMTDIVLADVGAVAHCMAVQNINMKLWLKTKKKEELEGLLEIYRDPSKNYGTKLKEYAQYVAEIKRIEDIKNSLQKASASLMTKFLDAYQQEYGSADGTRLNHKGFEKDVEIEHGIKEGRATSSTAPAAAAAANAMDTDDL